MCMASRQSKIALKKSRICCKLCSVCSKIGWKKGEDFFDVRWRAHMAAALTLTEFILKLKEGEGS